ncbi:RNA polymerase sigma factor CnrH [Aeoliella mucimassa]|uniref:RNA polymerase sigma factor CnrH n=1 Tax=Aeoliella mucimassa TaxID=2527972 RepID=A0A518APL0_9BACT|nr:RNA polymerase sigma factor CnrH [Aeoliella mucimassa]
MSESDKHRVFINRLTGAQQRLYAYIYTQLGPGPNVDDVLQETNLSLWENADSYDPSRPFMPWAYQFAYNRVRAYRASLSRSRLIFDEKLLAMLHETFTESPLAGDSPLEALQGCVERLSKDQKQLLGERYEGERSLTDLAKQLGESITCLTSRLHRIRRDLARCIQGKMAAEVAK